MGGEQGPKLDAGTAAGWGDDDDDDLDIDENSIDKRDAV